MQFTYLIGKKHVERKGKRHKPNQHPPRCLTEPLQEPWFGLTGNFNMFFSAACVRDLLMENKNEMLETANWHVCMEGSIKKHVGNF